VQKVENQPQEETKEEENLLKRKRGDEDIVEPQDTIPPPVLEPLAKKGEEAQKNKQNGEEKKKADDEDPADNVQLWLPGWKQRYYESKFHVSANDEEFINKLAYSYAEGFSWVMKYYYQGCPSWNWYFPQHYSPFASDFKEILGKTVTFIAKGRPFKPFEQLMGVFPAASRDQLPKPYHYYMTDPSSPIIDFYPEDFEIDLNGKRYSWQGVALLPFVDETRLLEALKDCESRLSEEELRRNSMGQEMLFISTSHKLYSQASKLYDEAANVHEIVLDAKLTGGFAGTLKRLKDAQRVGEPYQSPLDSTIVPDLLNNLALATVYIMPTFPEGHVFKSNLIEGVQLPPKELTPGDLTAVRSQSQANIFGRQEYNNNPARNNTHLPYPGQSHNSQYSGNQSYNQRHNSNQRNYSNNYPSSRDQSHSYSDNQNYSSNQRNYSNNYPSSRDQSSHYSSRDQSQSNSYRDQPNQRSQSHNQNYSNQSYQQNYPQSFPQQSYPQQQSYQQNYPQSFPQQTYPQSFPQQTYPQQSFQQSSFPQQTYPQQSYAQQQSYPQQQSSFPQQTYPQQSYAQQQSYPQQSYPQQSFPQQTYPQQSFQQPLLPPQQQSIVNNQPAQYPQSFQPQPQPYSQPQLNQPQQTQYTYPPGPPPAKRFAHSMPDTKH